VDAAAMPRPRVEMQIDCVPAKAGTVVSGVR
jgi:hypothetical protein